MDAEPVDIPAPPPRLIATGASGPAVAACSRPASAQPSAATSSPVPLLSCAGGTSALALLLHAALGEVGDTRVHVAADGSVVVVLGDNSHNSMDAAPHLTCRLRAGLDPLLLSSLIFEFSCPVVPALPLMPHTALAVAAIASGGAAAPLQWARSFIQRVQQCCALHSAIIDETRADSERNAYQVEFADSSGSSAFMLYITPSSRCSSSIALPPLALALPITYPHVSPRACFSSTSAHLRPRFLALMQQHSQPWPVSLMVQPPAPLRCSA
jgi:hypothetical protein